MTRYFVLSYLLSFAATILFLGIGKYPNDNFSVTLYGYGRFAEIPAYLAVAALGLAAAWNFVQWRKTRSGLATTSIHFVLANVWFVASLLLILGTWSHPWSSARVSIFGHGRFESPPVYIVNVALVMFMLFSLRRWYKEGRAGVTEVHFFSLANLWFLLGVVLLLGIAPHPGSSRYAAIFGYGKLEEASPYLAVGMLALAAFWNFRQWRKAGQPAVVAPPPVVPLLPPTRSRHRGAIAAVAFVGLFLFIAVLAPTTQTVVKPQAFQPIEQDFETRPVPLVTTPTAVLVFPFLMLLVGAVVWWLRTQKPARLVVDSSPSALPATPRPATPPPAAEPRQPRTCPKCHSAIAPDAPQGLCPRCLMAGAFQSILHPSRTGAYSGPFEAPTAEEVQEFFPNLEILGLIGQGGMGAVYQARQPNLDRIVAVKLIRPREDNPMFAERFVREAKAMAKLTHPNIVTIYESGEAGGSLYLIMEFIDGVTLREAIVAKAVDSASALRIVGQLCDALEYAHSQGVVHRDIKPENILLDRMGKVRVVDFGLAKLADDNAMSLTHTRQAMGTPHYMAPEQWEKPTEVDHRADIYALGVVIYELLTGELPLGRFDPPSVKARLDARIDEIVLRLLAKEPEKRYQKASDVRTAFFRIGDFNEPAAGVRRQYGIWGRRDYFYEYKSQTEYLGWPLVHVVAGIDPRTGTRRVAKGWIAVGDLMAIGGLAVGGVLSLGLFAIAGAFGLGILALCGALAVGGFALGGNAMGFIAIGGVALGWLAIGGAAIGKYALGGAAVGEVTNKNGAISNLWERVWADIASWF